MDIKEERGKERSKLVWNDVKCSSCPIPIDYKNATFVVL
jgi:hypothetical protein